MKVVLNADIEKLGRKGDVVEVAPGYARNFLLPRNLAIPGGKGSLRQAEEMVRAREEKDRRERAAFEGLVNRIAATPLRISARAGEDGQLFGSVTTSEIAEMLSEALGEEIDRRKVELAEPIRSTGTHEFSVQLHREVTARGTVEVVPAAPAPPGE